MALAAGTVWEVNASATSGNVCGGGFNPTNTGNGGTCGTDYTLLANNANYPAAKYSFTDLASTLASGFLVVTSSSHTFVDADCGNLIHINTTGSGAHFTVGWYEIKTTSGGAATLDRACGSTADASGGSYQIGGALSLQHSTDQATCNTFVAGNKVWIKNGTYTLTGTLNINTAVGTVQSQISFEGYNSTRGDRPTGSSRPTITGGVFICGVNFNFTSIIFSHNTGSSALFTPGSRNWAYQCKFVMSTTSTGVAAVAAAGYNTYINCEMVSYRGVGITSGSELTVANCYIHDCDVGIKNTNAANNYGSDYVNNIIESCVTAGLQYTSTDDTGDMIAGNTFFGGISNKTGKGIDMATGGANKRIWNNIFYGFVTAINHADSSQALQGTSIWMNWNNFYNNTTDVTNCTKGSQDIALDPQFSSVQQITGTAGSLSTVTLTDNSADFSNVVNNQDFCYVISGTGATAAQYLITGHTTHTLTLSSAPGGSGTNINYQVTTGRNFGVGLNMANVGSLGAFPGGLTTGYQAIGAVERSSITPTKYLTIDGAVLVPVVQSNTLPVLMEIA